MTEGTQPYSEGDWFAVPLGDGRYVLGRIARHYRGIVFAYFFEPAFDHVPTLEEAGGRLAGDAFTQMMVSHLDLVDGSWPVLSRSDDWDPASWPLVEFERRTEWPGRPDVLEAIGYDERRLNQEVSCVRLDPSEAGKRPEDRLSGAGAAIVHLRRAVDARRAG